jgi:hypothetical protein
MTEKQAIVIAANHIRSASEAREKGRAGGKKSGESRRAKADLKKALMECLAVQPTINGTHLANMPDNLNCNNYLSAIISNLVLKASYGNTAAIGTIMRLLD